MYDTIFSMMNDVILKGKPNPKTVISNLRLFADYLEEQL